MDSANAVQVTARRTPGKNGSSYHCAAMRPRPSSHSPANAGQEWKRDGARLVGDLDARHSPANAGQEWKREGVRSCASDAHQVTARRTPGKDGSYRRGAVGEEAWVVTARRTPGKNGSEVDGIPAVDAGVGHSPANAGQEWKLCSRAAPARPSPTSQPGERRARMEAWARSRQQSTCASHSPANAGQEWKRRRRLGAVPAADVTARRTPGKNGSHQAMTRCARCTRVTARRTPGKNGSRASIGDVPSEVLSQPGERRARMEARRSSRRTRSSTRSQLGERRARMEAGSTTLPGCAATMSQPGERRARMEGRSGCRGRRGSRRHSPANAGQEWKRGQTEEHRDSGMPVTAR